MKNKKNLLAILALALVFVMAFAGCASTGGGSASGGNNQQKVIRVTGIPDEVYNAYKASQAWILVVPEGSVTGNNPFGKDVAYSVNRSNYIATLPANTLALGLYDKNDKPWRGNGVYDLWLLEGNSTIAAKYKYKAVSVDVSTSPTLDFNSAFTKVE